MLTKLIAIGVLFFLILYLSNARGMKEAALTMVLSGEAKVDNRKKEEEALRNKIRLYKIGMIALFIAMFGVVAVTVPVFLKWIIE
ncbi:hypothetical protein [Paenibacillus sp. Y412MC10]|uniref:hypothetical protein n=1 Tax=Geobacillus sp. (strain Y412MC10) TaxID=481743 RepID=UPI0011AB7C9F|nr:hypothetical protein [Paenibacillus sp. Y412MC10]